MICSLTIDCDDAPDFPGGIGTALGRPIAAYPLIAARSSGQAARHYVVTSSPAVKSVAAQNDAVIIDPPGAHEPWPSEKMLAHGFRALRDDLHGEKEPLELLLVFHAHTPSVTGDLIIAGVDALRAKPELDSAISVSPRPRWNPSFARREAGGLLEAYGPASEPSGEVLYPNWSVMILRPRQLENPSGDKPFPWLGKKVFPLKQWGGGPVDFKWQIPSIEYWLKKHGYSDLTPSMELQPKPQPKPQPERPLR
jgi:hypothetical protein